MVNHSVPTTEAHILLTEVCFSLVFDNIRKNSASLESDIFEC